MRVDMMREAIIAQYSPVIKGRNVYDMPDCQILAIYHRMINQGVIPKAKIPKKYRLNKPVRYEQMRMEI